MDLSRAQWRKSSRSATESNCVEVAAAEGRVAMRDSKNPTGSILILGVREWTTFLTDLKADTLNRSSR